MARQTQRKHKQGSNRISLPMLVAVSLAVLFFVTMAVVVFADTSTPSGGTLSNIDTISSTVSVLAGQITGASDQIKAAAVDLISSESKFEIGITSGDCAKADTALIEINTILAQCNLVTTWNDQIADARKKVAAIDCTDAPDCPAAQANVLGTLKKAEEQNKEIKSTCDIAKMKSQGYADRLAECKTQAGETGKDLNTKKEPSMPGLKALTEELNPTPSEDKNNLAMAAEYVPQLGTVKKTGDLVAGGIARTVFGPGSTGEFDGTSLCAKNRGGGTHLCFEGGIENGVAVNYEYTIKSGQIIKVTVSPLSGNTGVEISGKAESYYQTGKIIDLKNPIGSLAMLPFSLIEYAGSKIIYHEPPPAKMTPEERKKWLESK